MFVKDGNTYRKVYTRKNGSRYFMKDGKRIDFYPSYRHVIVNTKPLKDCSQDKERLPSGRCSKKCTPSRTRNPRTRRCKSSSPRRSPLRPLTSSTTSSLKTHVPRFFNLSNGNNYITIEKEKEMYEGGLRKFILDNNLRHGDIIYIGSSVKSRPEYGYYIVDIRKPNKVISNKGLYMIDPHNDELYNKVMDEYIQMLGYPVGISYRKIKNELLSHLRKITE